MKHVGISAAGKDVATFDQIQVASRLGVFSGTTSSVTGTQRYYPETNRIISAILMWASSPVPGGTSATIRKNGAVLATCSIATGQLIVPKTTLSVALLTTDYLTIDLSSSGALDVVVRIDFQGI